MHCLLLGPSQEVDSIVYKWNERTELFEEYQAIMTIGAYDWTYFSVEGYHFLALAQAFNGITTLFESRIYVFQKNGFYLFQTMEVINTCGRGHCYFIYMYIVLTMNFGHYCCQCLN